MTEPLDPYVDYSYAWDGQSEDDMLAKMRQGWRGPSPCGYGSTKPSAERTIRSLRQVHRELDVRTLANIGAGDLAWWTHELRKLFTATQLDLVPRNVEVVEFDCTTEAPPQCDAVLYRYVLNHLSARRVYDALRLLKESGSTYLMLTTKPKQEAYWAEFGIELPEPLFDNFDYEYWQLRTYLVEEVTLP